MEIPDQTNGAFHGEVDLGTPSRYGNRLGPATECAPYLKSALRRNAWKQSIRSTRGDVFVPPTPTHLLLSCRWVLAGDRPARCVCTLAAEREFSRRVVGENK